MTPPLVIGLTGGIGSGKSTVAELFAARAVAIIDADVVAREQVEPGTEGYRAIVERLGREVLTETDALDRSRLRERIFADDALRAWLEALLHPRIRQAMESRLATLDVPYAVLVIPLLLEAGQSDLVDRVLVVDTTPALQMARTRERDGASRKAVERIMQRQASRAARLAAADDVIVNDAGREELERAVEALHRSYLALAGRREKMVRDPGRKKGQSQGP